MGETFSDLIDMSSSECRIRVSDAKAVQAFTEQTDSGEYARFFGPRLEKEHRLPITASDHCRCAVERHPVKPPCLHRSVGDDSSIRSHAER